MVSLFFLFYLPERTHKIFGLLIEILCMETERTCRTAIQKQSSKGGSCLIPHQKLCSLYHNSHVLKKILLSCHKQITVCVLLLIKDREGWTIQESDTLERPRRSDGCHTRKTILDNRNPRTRPKHSNTMTREGRPFNKAN